MLDYLNHNLKDKVLELEMNMVPALMEEEMRTEMLELEYYLDLTRGLRDTDTRILAIEIVEMSAHPNPPQHLPERFQIT